MKLKPPTEDQEQQVLAQWLDLHGFTWCHIPNGGSRNKIEAAKLKRMGVKAGMPDVLIFDKPFWGIAHNGTAIELKSVKGKLMAAQKQWLNELEKRGWLTFVAFGARQAIEFLTKNYDLAGLKKMVA